MKPIAGILLLILIISAGCKKDSFITTPDAQISFSSDTLRYDTVFTSTGSVTQVVRIYNNNDRKLKLTSVELAGTTNSPFRINVDGLAGNASGIEIQANDSLYVFVSVTIDPDSENIPFIVQDSIRVRFNGTERFVQLEAYGQNANFFRDHVVTGTEIWTSGKPYVILNSLLIEKNARLTITEGTRIYFHADAPLIVDGTLQVNGQKYDSTKVRFLGDRLDEPYKEYPGSWPGIYFRADSKDNVIEHAIIGNAYQGVVAEEPASNGLPKLVLNETIIQNCFDAGLIGTRTSIKSRNTLISNCGKNLAITFGGDYNFDHLTNVSTTNAFIAHKDPVLTISNVYEDNTGSYTADLNAVFQNSIFWGDDGLVNDEVTVRKEGTSVYNVVFSNSIWKVTNDPAGVTTNDMINKQDPLFVLIDSDKRIYDYRLQNLSPAIGIGVATGVLTDLDGNPRKPTNPDAGAFEKQ